jgi:hypothetical protein
VAQGVQRDVPGERGLRGRGSGARKNSPAPVFRTTPCLLRLPGRRDMLARVGLSPRSRAGAFMPDGGDPLTGRLAGCPGSGAATDSKQVLCEGYGFALPVPRRRGANPSNWRSSVGARGRAVLASGGRVRRGPSPGWLRGGRKASGLHGRQRPD